MKRLSLEEPPTQFRLKIILPEPRATERLYLKTDLV